MAPALCFLHIFLFINIYVIRSYAMPPYANVTVALDGTGNFSSVGAAVLAAPNNSQYSHTIYIKQGVYNENVKITQEKVNLIMFGDGINKTIITFNKSYNSGYGTMYTATFDITTSWFLARDISFVNSAGADAGPAVALRTAGDYIACHRCSIEGHQDTLMIAYGSNQFFSECDIYGTTDFIFGDANVIIQNSFIYARIPQKGHGNAITASGRENNETNSGIVIHNCTITSAPEFEPYKSIVKTHLGRPWKKYARTIVMESFLDDLIDPEGWRPFDDSSNLTTLYYAEYANYGPGSLDGRVKWPGYHILTNADEVQKFIVENYINGSEWLPQLGVPFISKLVS